MINIALFICAVSKVCGRYISLTPCTQSLIAPKTLIRCFIALASPVPAHTLQFEILDGVLSVRTVHGRWQLLTIQQHSAPAPSNILTNRSTRRVGIITPKLNGRPCLCQQHATYNTSKNKFNTSHCILLHAIAHNNNCENNSHIYLAGRFSLIDRATDTETSINGSLLSPVSIRSSVQRPCRTLRRSQLTTISWPSLPLLPNVHSTNGSREATLFIDGDPPFRFNTFTTLVIWPCATASPSISTNTRGGETTYKLRTSHVTGSTEL